MAGSIDLESIIRQWIEEQLAPGVSAGEINSAVVAMAVKTLIAGTLARHNGNFSAAAEDLVMNRTTLRKKAGELNIESQDRT